MDNEKFVDNCKKIIRKYVEEHLDKSEPIPEFNIFVVWLNKTLQNNKALVSTTLPDKMYYEITYNGDKKEFYLDAYVKLNNECIKMEEEKNDGWGDKRRDCKIFRDNIKKS